MLKIIKALVFTPKTTTVTITAQINNIFGIRMILFKLMNDKNNDML